VIPQLTSVARWATEVTKQGKTAMARCREPYAGSDSGRRARRQSKPISKRFRHWGFTAPACQAPDGGPEHLAVGALLNLPASADDRGSRLRSNSLILMSGPVKIACWATRRDPIRGRQSWPVVRCRSVLDSGDGGEVQGMLCCQRMLFSAYAGAFVCPWRLSSLPTCRSGGFC